MSRRSPGPIVIFGARGKIGRALVEGAGDADVRPLGREDVDIADTAAVAACLDALRPSAAINCAVSQPVDRCESERPAAIRINAVAAGELAIACAERDVRLWQMSTDYVFDGAQRRPYAEDDRPRPLSVYAATKLAGEHLVLAASPRHSVIRTAAVFGATDGQHGLTSFVDSMLRRAREGEETRVVHDQVVSPTYAADLAAAVWRLLSVEDGGVFHVTNVGECSWYEIAARVFEAAGRPDLLSRTTAAEFGAPAPRPPYSALDNARLRELGLPELPPWGESLDTYLSSVV